MRKTFVFLMAMTAMLCHARAQQMAVDEAGTRVARIAFDREEVTLIYSDSTSATVTAMQVRREASAAQDQEQTLGIIAVERYEPDADAELYDMQGRRVAAANEPGIYIERREKSVRKVVKTK